jgi:hypothetical protein
MQVAAADDAEGDGGGETPENGLPKVLIVDCEIDDRAAKYRRGKPSRSCPSNCPASL